MKSSHAQYLFIYLYIYLFIYFSFIYVLYLYMSFCNCFDVCTACVPSVLYFDYLPHITCLSCTESMK